MNFNVIPCICTFKKYLYLSHLRSAEKDKNLLNLFIETWKLISEIFQEYRADAAWNLLVSRNLFHTCVFFTPHVSGLSILRQSFTGPVLFCFLFTHQYVDCFPETGRMVSPQVLLSHCVVTDFLISNRTDCSQLNNLVIWGLGRGPTMGSQAGEHRLCVLPLSREKPICQGQTTPHQGCPEAEMVLLPGLSRCCAQQKPLTNMLFSRLSAATSPAHFH